VKIAIMPSRIWEMDREYGEVRAWEYREPWKGVAEDPKTERFGSTSGYSESMCLFRVSSHPPIRLLYTWFLPAEL
jgi:hypothetical protein